MAAAIIELNDHELRLAENGKIVARSPGCAIVKGTDITVGEAACRQAHLHPRDYHNRFWYQLNQVSLRKPSRAARHHADLAFKHLEQLHRAAGAPDAVIFVISAGFSKQQLALLLGIAEACKINTVALVDAAVASAAHCVAPGTYRHIEIELHRVVVTDLLIDVDVTRTNVDVIDGAGFDKLSEKFVAFIADQFLAQSRFDPLHQANTEQRMFDELPNWLQALQQRREIKIYIEHRQARFEATISRDDIVDVAQPLYKDIRARIAAHDRCLIGPRLASLPGFIELPATQFVLSEEMVFGGCASLAKQPAKPNQGLSVITRLTAAEDPSIALSTSSVEPAPVQPSTSGAVLATHVLCGIHAYELSTTPLYLTADGRAERSLSGHSIASLRHNGSATHLVCENDAQLRLNDLPVKIESPVVSGDKITLEGSTIVYRPIRVVAPDAP